VPIDLRLLNLHIVLKLVFMENIIGTLIIETIFCLFKGYAPIYSEISSLTNIDLYDY